MEAATTTQNPLEIPEVLATVFGYLPLKDLKSSNLVNRHWNVWALSAMKKIPSAPVNVSSFEEMAALLTCLRNIPGGASKFPCSKFNLKCQLIPSVDKESLLSDDGIAEVGVLLSDFLLTISSWVTELTWKTSLSLIEHKHEIFRTVFPRMEFPNLKVLVLVRRGPEFTQISLRNFNLLVTNILEKAPSLKKLSCTGSIDNLVKLIVTTKISFFTEMELIGNIGNSDLETLSKWNRELKLKSLSLTFWRTTLNNTSLFQFLGSQNDSLEKLKLNFRWISLSLVNENATVVTFPEMPNLKTLSIQFPTNVHLSFPEISYTRQFPALKTLHFNHYKTVNSEFSSVFQELLNPRMEPVVTVEELTLPSFLTSVEPLMLALGAAIFPNVKKLEVESNPDILGSVYSHLPNLEELTLDCTRSSGSIDFMLTGHSKLRKTIKDAIQRNAFPWNRFELGIENESIAALQKLRVLRLRSNLYTDYLEIGTHSLELILTRMGSLKCIDFGVRAYPMDKVIDSVRCKELNKDCDLLWIQNENI